MFRLSDLYNNIIRKPLPTDCGIACEPLDPYMAKLNRLMTESVSCYSYTIVTHGTQLITYNDKQALLSENDLFITTPGMMVTTLEVSDDYSAVCLMADEMTTYEIPYARNIVSAAYFPASAGCDNRLTLTPQDTEKLLGRMKEIDSYINSSHIFKKEALFSTYSLFILDLLNIENYLRPISQDNSHTLDLFMRFLMLINKNFSTHHDIAFYADSLYVTPIYLSRIVKRFSGQTVKDHIDRLILMEAAYLLTNTDKPIAEIAGELCYANPSSFCKFFTRQKGISPRNYRAGNRPQ